jgi:hypothetical protein
LVLFGGRISTILVWSTGNERNSCFDDTHFQDLVSGMMPWRYDRVVRESAR